MILLRSCGSQLKITIGLVKSEIITIRWFRFGRMGYVEALTSMFLDTCPHSSEQCVVTLEKSDLPVTECSIFKLLDVKEGDDVSKENHQRGYLPHFIIPSIID